MTEPHPASVTMLLQDWRRGNGAALEEVARVVDRELRRLAASYLRRERPGHTLQPTALVNEAFLRLMGQGDNLDWESRSQFMGIVARHMRQILVDHARRHNAGKRGSGATLIPIDEAPACTNPRSADLMALDEALEKLAEVDPRKARAMELKYFGGLEMAEIAGVLNVSIKTVEKDVRMAGAWLRAALTSAEP
ncbi:MAG TPA: sigma-70 family RNA polymerase sigma factor [Terracidiphilus sp.]|nr:sigma-70 family RNA polymerase sigma factor [Terracidiphilus sp.]